MRALNDGKPGWSPTHHLLADLWILMLQAFSENSPVTDHPVRAEMEAKANEAAQAAHMAELKADFERRKRMHKNRYGGE